MDYDSSVKTITLKDIGNIFLKYSVVILLVATLVTGVLALVKKVTFVPRYQSTATLYILRQNDEGNTGGAVASDFSLALNVVNDCTYILKMHSVLDKVSEEVGLDIPYEKLKRSVSTSNPANTRILEVTVEADSPELAKSIVDSICTVGAEKIKEDMGFAQVNISEYGIIDSEPCNRTGKALYLLVWLLTAVVMYVVFLLIYILDDGIRSDDDVRKYLGLSVLGEIPNANTAQKSGYYSYARHSGTSGKKGS